MEINIKNLVIFFLTYLLIIFISNMIFSVYLAGGLSSVLPILTNIPAAFSFPPLFCTMSSLNFWDNNLSLGCFVDLGTILLYTYFAIMSCILVFTKKLKYYHWVIAFIIFNLLGTFFLLLRDQLYLGR